MVKRRRRGRARGWTWGRVLGALLLLVLPVLIVAALLALPVLLPFVALQERRTARRKRALVATWPCGWCAAPLTTDALARADALYAAHVETLHGDDGILYLRMVRDLDACCPRCGAGHRFEDPARFRLLDRREFASVYGALATTAVPPPGATMAWPWLAPTQAMHAVALTRDSVCLADDGDAPHPGTVEVPAAADVAALAEALLRSPWLPHVGQHARWYVTAGEVGLAFGLADGMPFLDRSGSEPARCNAVAGLHLTYGRSRG